MLPPSVETFLRQAPVDVDATTIVQAWQRLRPPYDVERWMLPLPPWARRPYTETGVEAWAMVQRELSDAARTGPMCIYVHVPFCASKCGFCNSYFL